MYNPRFEEDFAAGRDYDPDRRALSADLNCCPVEAHCASAHEA